MLNIISHFLLRSVDNNYFTIDNYNILFMGWEGEERNIPRVTLININIALTIHIRHTFNPNCAYGMTICSTVYYVKMGLYRIYCRVY